MNELRQELEARSLSTKGLKNQLVERLSEALKEEAKREIDELEKSGESFMEVDKVEDEKIDEEENGDEKNDVEKNEDEKNSDEKVETEEIDDDKVDEDKTETIEVYYLIAVRSIVRFFTFPNFNLSFYRLKRSNQRIEHHWRRNIRFQIPLVS